MREGEGGAGVSGGGGGGVGNYCVRKSHEGAIKVHARERTRVTRTVTSGSFLLNDKQR